MPRLAPLALALALAVALRADEEQGPEASRLDDANRAAAEQVYRTVAREGDALTNRLRGLRKEDVVVVGGLFDFVQELLVAFRLPHTVIRPEDLEHLDLEPVERKVFLLNCHLMDRTFPESQQASARPDAKDAAVRLERVLREAGLAQNGAPGEAIRKRFEEVKDFAGSRYSVDGLKRLGAAIQAGAWCFSTDWALLAVERALPGTLRWTGHTTFEETVEVRPSLVGRRHPLLEGVFGEKGKARWWLETEAYLFSVKGPHQLLVESRPLAARYHGNRNVVVLIEPGKGRALHALSHTYLQKGRTDDLTAMQRLLANFLIEKSLQNFNRERERRRAQEESEGG